MPQSLHALPSNLKNAQCSNSNSRELGTIPLESANKSRPKTRCLLDQDLKPREREVVYVCDPSIFPYSPGVNPTLTVVALALRLSKFIHPPQTPVLDKDVDTVHVMDQTGNGQSLCFQPCRGAANPARDRRKRGKENFGPGEVLSRRRSREADETTMVYQLDFIRKDTCQPRPVL